MHIEEDQHSLISVALNFKSINVAHIMTKINDVYIIPSDCILDLGKIAEITATGHSRVPIYEREKNNVIASLHVKDFAWIEPKVGIPALELSNFFKHSLNYTKYDVTLDVILNQFKQGWF